MKDYIIKRALELAQYIVDNNSTVREAGKVFCVSKSTVHKDITERLKDIDFKLYQKVQKILDINLSERHIRGGNATKSKYRKK